MNLMDLLQSESFFFPIWVSLKIGVSATLLSMLIAFLIHYLLINRTFPGKSIIETIIMLPMVLPPTVIGFILLIAFGRTSFIGKIYEAVFRMPLIFSLQAAILASTLVALPLMYQSLKIGIEQINKDTIGAALVDGADRWMLFKSIILPLSKPALATGLLMSFARAIGEFGATLIFAGNIPGVTQTMPTAIYVAIENNEMLFAASWVVMMIMMSFIMMFITQKIRPDA